MARMLAEGRAMSWDQAIDYALTHEVESPTLATQPSLDPGRLTAREREILRLLANGKSNSGIAAELVVSVYTVERHVANIYTKIEVHSRVEATAYALRHGLV
jgi:DNA-binding NarL/FixJ family response regulator